MEIDKRMVDYVANLSRIELSDEQSSIMQSELAKIINYMDVLKAVDTDGVEPLSHVFSITNAVRNDVVAEHLNRDLLLQNAPEKTGETFVVPKAVDGA